MPQVGWRHALRNIVADDAPQRLGRHPARLIFDIEPEVRLPLCGVRTVACVAVV